jgi:hypothetical protein
MKYQDQSLIKPVIHHPPITPYIPLTWAIKRHTLLPSKSKKEKKQAVTLNTARKLRSAAYCYYEQLFALEHPELAYNDSYSNHAIFAPGCTPSGNIIFTQNASGKPKLLGTESEPIQALTWEHIAWNQEYHQHRF